MNAKDDIYAYAVLIRARKVRGQRMESELIDLEQAHTEKIRIQQHSFEQHEAASLKLIEHVQHVSAILSSREVMKTETILRERAHLDFLVEIQKRTHAKCELAAEDVSQCIDSCNDLRRRIAINEERVNALRTQEQEVRVRLASKSYDLEEEEQEEAFEAGRRGRNRRAFP